MAAVRSLPARSALPWRLGDIHHHPRRNAAQPDALPLQGIELYGQARCSTGRLQAPGHDKRDRQAAYLRPGKHLAVAGFHAIGSQVQAAQAVTLMHIGPGQVDDQTAWKRQ